MDIGEVFTTAAGGALMLGLAFNMLSAGVFAAQKRWVLMSLNFLPSLVFVSYLVFLWSTQD